MTSPLFPRTPSLSGDDVVAKREEIRAYFHATFDRYEQLFEVLVSDAAYYEKPIPLRHPLIFYFGHTATFFVNKLVLAGLLHARIEPRFESMFAVGVDEMSWDDLDATHYDWPSVEAVRAYRRQVRAAVAGVIATMPLTLPIDWNEPAWVVLMGIEHERIHLETSSVLIRQHALKHVRPHPAWQPWRASGAAPLGVPINALVDIPAGAVSLGKTDASYGWDNEYTREYTREYGREYGRHDVQVPAFQASRHLVSNQEFLEFVQAGGYADDAWWDAEGRAWKTYAQALHPTFWIAAESANRDDWRLRLMLEEVPMPWNWPVEVNCLEASAFCAWKAARVGLPVRLPSEDEWGRLYAYAGLAEVPETAVASANLHLDHAASACPVDTFKQGELYDVVGNVWQWTQTPIYPFDGFRVHPLYDDFTTPTFDGRHNLFKGGSWISSGNESRKSARYAFRRHFFQHAGFRYVVAEAASSTETATPASHYETDKLLSEYAEFHYGDSHFGVENFPKALADLAIRVMGARPARHALDLGCAAGRASFELARHFAQVTGIDFSARFIGLGVQMAEQGRLRYTFAEEGELVSYHERRLADLALEQTRGKVDFFQGDACNLKPNFTGYDLILAANLVDRLYSPAKFLASVHERINLGGLLLLATPCTWLEEHTPRAEWIGGFKQDGENFTTLDGLKAALGAHFRHIVGPLDVPFVLRETRRKFQHTVSEVTVWERT
ncbi:MAG: 5-histidylcysteine sulfoxide synthase [Pseudomonadota bacterium]|nr:5-histidylcysteine sulfoxide synthase [Pseudomonadota bacterium]